MNPRRCNTLLQLKAIFVDSAQAERVERDVVEGIFSNLRLDGSGLMFTETVLNFIHAVVLYVYFCAILNTGFDILLWQQVIEILKSNTNRNM